jgi:poly-gamma-glutamate synthesis protein (capsule biosynthesis protein)
LVFASDWAPLEELADSIVVGKQFQAVVSDPGRFYGDLAEVLRDADLAVVNLECVLGQAGEPIVKDGPHLRLPARAVDGLAAIPFRLVCLATNHSLDFGPEGLARTRQLLTEKGLFSVGAGQSEEEARRPFVTKIGEVRLGIINAAEGEEGRSANGGASISDLDPVRLVRQIAALRDQVDVLIAVVHAGREWVPVPPPYINHTYRALVEAGADLIVGHHPHVPQGIEIYQGQPIVYSLGNFALWTPKCVPHTRLGFVLRSRFRGTQLTRLEIIPYRMRSDCLCKLSDEERRPFLRDLAQASDPLGDSSKVEAFWHAYADCWLERGLAQDLAAISPLLLDESDLRDIWLSTLSKRRDIWTKLFRRGIRSLGGLAASMASDPSGHQRARGAAILHNRFRTPAHRELYLTALQREMDSKRGNEEVWAMDLLERWRVFVSE